MKDADAQLVGARGAAIKSAEAKAQDYAKLAGFRGVELVSISEGSFGGGPQPPMPYARGLMAAEAKATPVEPGQVANTLTLNFQYRLVREFQRGVGANRPLFPFVSSEFVNTCRTDLLLCDSIPHSHNEFWDGRI